MSLLAALAATTPGTPLDPADGYGTLGSLTATMRPTWGRIIPVGAGRTFTTIGAALEEAQLEPFAQPNRTPNGSTGELNILARGLRPYKHRVLLALDPGTYDLTEILDAGDGIDLAGTGSTPDEVQIRSVEENYSLRTFGSMYVRNLTLWHADGSATGNSYPFHGSEVAGVANPTNVFDNVWFRDTSSDSSGVVGWDLSNGQTAIFYRCRFTTDRETGYVTNIHDMPDNTLGHDVAFIECIHDGTDMEVRYLNPPAKGNVWIKDCETSTGTPIADSLTVDDGTPGPITTEPPIPAASMSARELERYEPEATSGATLATNLGTTSTVTLVAGRTYYVPLGALPWSCLVDLARAEVTSAGAVAVGLYLERPNLRPGKPSTPLIWQTQAARSVGVLSAATQNPYGVLGLDVGMKVWVGVRTDGAAQVKGYAAAGATACWYEDNVDVAVPTWPSATLTAVGSGDPVPWGQLVVE